MRDVRDVLVKARDLLATGGVTKFVLHEDGKFCARGAIFEAGNTGWGRNRLPYETPIIEAMATLHPNRFGQQYSKDGSVVAYRGSEAPCDIAWWNNHPATTPDDVIAAFDLAILRLTDAPSEAAVERVPVTA